MQEDNKEHTEYERKSSTSQLEEECKINYYTIHHPCKKTIKNIEYVRVASTS